MEGDELVQNAAAIQAFVASGGGLVSHGCEGTDDCEIAYGWLTALAPNLVVDGDDSCDAVNAYLTAAGQAALPNLNNSDTDENAGPCHNIFGGDFGTLQPLARDGDDDAFILGGLVTTLASGTPAPVMGTSGLLAISALFFGVAARRLRRRS